ncbi:hypothetical protein BUALT_BualtUnG0005600 [Buddleja alternifolia]|uniref:H/ACA ribonucleoprotein complex non-core subunit NAF1 n=1 Tax=Buddleja alternifolia TaxID=168488 RepID=A0AAV6W408_9LAMI|nr:hypothetical protein BUALT_BualtUnG0005600 [Buddleja alternifolia]
MLSDADEMVAWSDNEDDVGETGVMGPITSKNELKELPPVPSVTATLQPHHQTLPVGIILSKILQALTCFANGFLLNRSLCPVIVEGVEKHNPLSEGSILWITESRLPLGIVDEIFGPVKNPYYIVRYNSESEVPPGIQQGSTLISFVQEFANHILNDKSLYQKGYDASGENDEEISDDLEFSDDEKEAEYKRMLKMKKRGTSESNNKPVTKRNEKRQFKKQTGNPNRNRAHPTEKTQLNQENHMGSSGLGPGLGGDQPVVPPFPQGAVGPTFCPPNGIWSNGFQHQQQQSLGLPNGLPANGMLWMQQQNQQQPYQLYQAPLQTGVNFQQQQMSTVPGMPFNFNPLCGQPNFVGAPGFAPWPTCLPQTLLNQPQFGMGLPGQHEQAVQSQGSQISHNMQPSPGNSEKPLNFNQSRGGGGGGGGRRGHHRGRGRFGGGRGRYQSH